MAGPRGVARPAGRARGRRALRSRAGLRAAGRRRRGCAGPALGGLRGCRFQARWGREGCRARGKRRGHGPGWAGPAGRGWERSLHTTASLSAVFPGNGGDLRNERSRLGPRVLAGDDSRFRCLSEDPAAAAAGEVRGEEDDPVTLEVHVAGDKWISRPEIVGGWGGGSCVDYNRGNEHCPGQTLPSLGVLGHRHRAFHLNTSDTECRVALPQIVSLHFPQQLSR